MRSTAVPAATTLGGIDRALRRDRQWHSLSREGRYHRHMTMKAQESESTDAAQLETAALSPAASLFHSLSDPTRLAILRHLSLGEHRVFELTAHLGLAQSTVSKHLACLRDCGLLDSRPVGRASMFSLTTRHELLELLAAAERLLALTGDAVELCPTFGATSRAEGQA